VPHPRALQQAFDALRFGPARTLNLREGLPTGADAARRAELWLREKQAEGAREVLLITGRGARSWNGVPVVRERVRAVLGALRRQGVVASVSEHTAGSFAVALAPLAARVAAERGSAADTATPPAPVVPDTLEGLDAEAIALLRRLALTALDVLGILTPHASQVEDEMRRQFVLLTGRLAASPDPGRALRDAARAEIARLEDIQR
jgi:hypothetical protein